MKSNVKRQETAVNTMKRSIVLMASAGSVAVLSACASPGPNEQLAVLNEQLEALQAETTDRGSVVTLDGVLFESGRSNLKSGADRKLQTVAAMLRNHPDRQLLIEGFTDSTGSDELNRKLSSERADAVMLDLVRLGVSRDRIRARQARAPVVRMLAMHPAMRRFRQA